jgi:hypothetical protein
MIAREIASRIGREEVRGKDRFFAFPDYRYQDHGRRRIRRRYPPPVRRIAP